MEAAGGFAKNLHDFRKKKSTIDAISEIVQKAHEAWERNNSLLD